MNTNRASAPDRSVVKWWIIELEIHNSYGSYTMLNIARLFPEKVFEKWAQLVGGWKWMKSTKNGIWFIIQIQKGDFFAGTKKRRRRIYKKCDDLKNVPFFFFFFHLLTNCWRGYGTFRQMICDVYLKENKATRRST